MKADGAAAGIFRSWSFVHTAQGFDAVEQILCGGSRVKLQDVEERGRITAERGVALAHAMQEVEIFRLREFPRLSHAGFEGVPG